MKEDPDVQLIEQLIVRDQAMTGEVLRVLGNQFGLDGFEEDSSEQVRDALLERCGEVALDNQQAAGAVAAGMAQKSAVMAATMEMSRFRIGRLNKDTKVTTACSQYRECTWKK